MAYIGKQPTVGNFQVCDAISVVNGQAAYTLQVGGVNVAPESANHMLVSLNGILQKPGSSFTISGSTMTFASNLATGDVIDFVQILGNVLDIGQPSDDTVTAAKLNDNVISGQTALTSSPDDTDELLISDAGTLKRIDVSLVGGKNTPAFLVKKTSSQAINDVTKTLVTWDAEEIDTDSAFASNKFTVPSGKAGKYFFSAIINLEDSSLYSTNLYFYKNGTEYSASAFGQYSDTNKISPSLVNNLILDLSVGDYIEVYAQGNTSDGGTCNVFDNGASTLFSWFQGYKLVE